MKPKNIPRINFDEVHKMSAMELNQERFQPKQTVLTPELVEELLQRNQKSPSVTPSVPSVHNADTDKTTRQS